MEPTGEPGRSLSSWTSGSGLPDANCPWLEGGPPPWLGDEPAAGQTLAAGASVVTFSGDKLLGGLEAGVIAGSGRSVARCRRHPLARVLRPGGLVLEALQEVALAYLRGDAGRTVPLWQLASTPLEVLRRRAEAVGRGQVGVPVGHGRRGPAWRQDSSVGVALPGDRTEALGTVPCGAGPGGRRADGPRPADGLPSRVLLRKSCGPGSSRRPDTSTTASRRWSGP